MGLEYRKEMQDATVRSSLELLYNVSRELASRLFRSWQRVMLRLPVQDAQCGFKAISAKAAKILLPQCLENSWLFDSELIALAVKQGFAVKEVPVAWIEHRNPARRSAIKLWKHGWEFLLGLAKIRSRINRQTM